MTHPNANRQKSTSGRQSPSGLQFLLLCSLTFLSVSGYRLNTAKDQTGSLKSDLMALLTPLLSEFEVAT